MSERVVPKTSEGGRPAYRIVCHECGCSDAVLAGTGLNGLDPTSVRKRFQNKGWIFGGSPKGDTCPGCRLKRAPPRSLVLKLAGSNESLPVGVIEMPKDTVVPIKADPPRIMSRDDRRIIFGKLEQVWNDGAKTYDDGWTDERVAKDLGVPRAWVATVRDENFGPAVKPEDVAFRDFKARYAVAYGRVVQQRATLEQAVKDLDEAIGALDKIATESGSKAA